jgi:hypothetical protein
MIDHPYEQKVLFVTSDLAYKSDNTVSGIVYVKKIVDVKTIVPVAILTLDNHRGTDCEVLKLLQEFKDKDKITRTTLHNDTLDFVLTDHPSINDKEKYFATSILSDF